MNQSVYLITSTATPRCYVGLTANPDYRWIAHKRTCVETFDAAHNKPLYEAMRHYGPETFSMRVVATYDNDADARAHETGLIHFHFASGQNPFNSRYRLPRRVAEIGAENEAKLRSVVTKRTTAQHKETVK